ncbi:ankyrin repeat domain-containing protein [Actinomycetospora sp. NBRC 106378]|uniref:ankyrin repeat domain-containing protein n=1 Tax=Actinomycetospora sp. NBRC 106378 TaxID=3032208 RepID=UPI0024A3D498|nr:ankyrin repeat domain-containing protein [Actinomycetospora sp. NBRC 106378]GLZ54051.1 hypothetical protein Acsp07_36680 [Actinomycetospora sp. NBRC 106378]
MPRPLPENPDLDQLRRQARDRRRAGGTTHALALRDVARDHGFPSWPALVRHVGVLEDLRWSSRPDDGLVGLACLRYSSDDSPARRDRAAALLDRDPGLAAQDLHTAVVCGRPDLVARLLAEGADPSADGGPDAWAPLMSLAYGRLGTVVPQHDDDVLACARLLLDAGADPAAGRCWHGLATPFTVLTGVLGHGERGPVDQPRHPSWRPLATVLLERGADPNDAQGLYDGQFEPDDEPLRLLLEHGLGRGDGGPWRVRLGGPSPAELLTGQLAWAVTHDLPGRVALLLDHGAVATPDLAADAARLGHRAVVDVLAAHGLTLPTLEPSDALVAAVLGGEEVTPASDLAARLAVERPALLVWAAATGRRDAVRRLVDLGVDVDTLGRGDVPDRTDPWETALHHAAVRGDGPMVEDLLALGASTSVRDARFGATAADWADHGGHTDLAARLRDG